MTERMWKGARWWKFDFHAHTPASADYGQGPEREKLQKLTPREWLLGYMRAGIDCVAITDHNTGAWVDRVKDALDELKQEQPEDFRDLHVFPGMEISVHGGIHLLALFAPSKTSEELGALRGAVKYQGEPGRSGGVTLKSFVDVVGEVVEAKGIAIPAHVDKQSGLFKLAGATLKQALECKDIFAMELVEQNFQKPQLYIDRKRNWAEVLGSDAHHPGGGAEQKYPGSHFTWVKMGSPGIEGLRLALLDGALSVRRFNQAGSDPNGHANSIIESIEVSGARYIGHKESFKQEFNPWLNAVIGGRGTGKSTLVEFLRLALRREEDLLKSLQSEFKKYGRVDTDKEDGGLLTNDAAIKVVYRKDDARFRVQWCPCANLESIEQEDIDGEWNRAEGDVRQRFPVRLYSQKEVFELAREPLALLNIVDQSTGVDRRSWSQEWKEEESRFLSLRAEARRIEAGLDEEASLRGELDDVKRKLAVFEQAGHADVLKTFQKRRRQQMDVEAWQESWIGTGNRLRETAAEIVPDLLDETSFDSDSREYKELKGYADDVRNRLNIIYNNIRDLASQADGVAEKWLTIRNNSSWKWSVDAAVQAYRELRNNLAHEGTHPKLYGDLVQRRQDIEKRLAELDGHKKQVGELKTQAEDQLRRLLKIRQKLTALRKKFLGSVLKDNKYVRIRIVSYEARETVEKEFRKLLQREEGGFEKDIGSPDGEGLLGRLYKNVEKPVDIEENLADIKDRVKKIFLNRHNPKDVADKRFTDYIGKLPPEALDRLDVWFPKDSLDVQYSAAGDRKRFQPIRQGSPGQKTAALLAFLLSYGEEPLILDQPEDDLDNHLIYDLIVNQLREIKRRRQVIVVTHNANIVVNGDAELVTALDARDGQTQKECEGSLQEKMVRDTICAVMEGGRKAFEDRYRRIALEGSHV